MYSEGGNKMNCEAVMPFEPMQNIVGENIEIAQKLNCLSYELYCQLFGADKEVDKETERDCSCMQDAVEKTREIMVEVTKRLEEIRYKLMG